MAEYSEFYEPAPGRYSESDWKNLPFNFIPERGKEAMKAAGIPNNLIHQLDVMQNILQNNLIKQLDRSYFSKDYFGVVKPVRGGDFGGLHPKTYNGLLRSQTEVFITSPAPGEIQFILDFGQADYWYYVDKGRMPGQPYQKKRKGGISRTGRALPRRSKKTGRFLANSYYTSYTKMPPLKDIMLWVEKKPALVNSDMSLETRTYLAMRSIARDGIYGINFIENAIRETETELNSPMGEFLTELFQTIINNQPIIKQSKNNIRIPL